MRRVNENPRAASKGSAFLSSAIEFRKSLSFFFSRFSPTRAPASKFKGGSAADYGLSSLLDDLMESGALWHGRSPEHRSGLRRMRRAFWGGFAEDIDQRPDRPALRPYPDFVIEHTRHLIMGQAGDEDLLLRILSGGSEADARKACFLLWGLIHDGSSESRERASVKLTRALRRRARTGEPGHSGPNLREIALCLTGRLDRLSPLFIAVDRTAGERLARPGPIDLLRKDPLSHASEKSASERFHRQLLDNPSQTLGGNAFYQTQALRNGICGFLPTQGCLIPVTHAGGPRLQFMLMGPFPDGSEADVARAARALARISKEEVIVKYVSPAQMGGLERCGLRPGAPCPPDRIEADLNNPEVVLDLHGMVSEDGGIIDPKLRGKVNSFLNWTERQARQNGRPLELRSTPLRASEDLERILPLLFRWTARKEERARRDGGEMGAIRSFLSHYDIVAGASPLLRGSEGLSALLLADDLPFGLFILSPTAHGSSRAEGGSLGLIAHISDSGMPGASEFVLWSAMVPARRLGYRYLNLGGAESDSLFAYKTKFAPHSLVSWHYATLPYSGAATSP